VVSGCGRLGVNSNVPVVGVRMLVVAVRSRGTSWLGIGIAGTEQVSRGRSESRSSEAVRSSG
jgi:hypothetical protein